MNRTNSGTWWISIARRRPTGRSCVICGSEIPREPGRGNSSYCSITCARLVTEARSVPARVLSKHIRDGHLSKASEFDCVDCGTKALDYDHRDYDRPLDVVPVCRSCNLKRGPAQGIRGFIARYLGVCENELHAEIEKIKAGVQFRRLGMNSALGNFPAPITTQEAA